MRISVYFVFNGRPSRTDMNHRDIAVLMDGIAPVLRGYAEKAFGPIVTRLSALESRTVAAGEKGEAWERWRAGCRRP